MDDLVPLRWLPDSAIIFGVSLNCSAIRSLLLPGSSQSKRDADAKELPVTLLSQNDREGGLANIRCLTLLCPNDREAALASSLEHVHRLVGLYLRFPPQQQYDAVTNQLLNHQIES